MISVSSIREAQEARQMELKEAVSLAKKYVGEVFANEQISNLGLEEVEFDDTSAAWWITIGFSRPWNVGGLAATIAGMSRRDYKVVRISDADGKMISIKNREMAK